MKKLSNLKLISFLWFLFLVTLYSQEKIVESSLKKPPDWIKSLPKETKEFVYSLGIRTNINSLEEGERQARINALSKLLETYFGVKGKNVYQKVRKTFETEYLDSMRVETKGELWGIKLIDWYWKKYEVSGSKGIEYRYDVFVLLQGDKKNMDKAVSLVLERTEKTKRAAKSKLIEAKMALTNHEVKEAIQKIEEVQKTIEILNEESFIREMKLELETLRQDIFQNLMIERITDEKIKPSSDGFPKLGVKVTFKDYPQKDIPVSFFFSQGLGTIKSPIFTNSEGIAEGIILKLKTPLKLNIVEAKVGYEGGNFVQFFIEPLVKNIGVLIVTYEEVNGKEITPGIVESRVSQVLSEAGFTIKNIGLPEGQIKLLIKENFNLTKRLAQNSGVNYIVAAEVKTKLIPKTGQFLFANATGVIKVINLEKGNIVISYAIDEKGAGVDETQAAENALKNAAEGLSGKIQEKLGELLNY